MFSTARKLISGEGDFFIDRSIDNRPCRVAAVVEIVRYIALSPPDRHIRLSTRAKLSPDYICFALVRFVRLTFSIEFVISLEGERIRLDVSYRVQAYNIFSSDAVPMFFKSDKIFCAGKSVCFVRSVFSRNALGHDSANVSKL